ncbi:hypothetical protein Ddye_023491 [Dipteronia dyeriana]|uniref:DDE Tnp4 domain-containing protein n=1 Tax=Dipteronia dyeriana TaxID=168575 RepID=A0AAD9TTN0_9ROSI|nr:hypothetical protein Ddye_023491 [Dipteronia dyeriana]
MLKFSKEMITPHSFNDNSNGIVNHRLRQMFKVQVMEIQSGLHKAFIEYINKIERSKSLVVVWGLSGKALPVLVASLSPDKYYLGDAAYTHTKGFMAPYRYVRYWLNDFHSGGRARGREEIFNHYHSRTRNVIEYAFGVLKTRFPTLKRMSPYSFGMYRNIVIACITLHNFLRKLSIDDELFLQYDDEDIQLDNDYANQNQIPSTNNEFRRDDQVFMQQLRDQIANQFL